MNKIVVDIVLFPSKKISYKAIELNKMLISDHRPFELNNKDFLPHLSLCMGSVEVIKMPEIKKKINEISKEIRSFKITINEIQRCKINTGEDWINLKIIKTKEIQHLHELILKKIRPYISNDVKKDMFYNSQDIDVATIESTSNYLLNSTYENFAPHISIGVGKLELEKINLSFDLDRIAICHLGKYCTCREILSESSFN